MLPPIAFRSPERARNRHAFPTPRHSEPNGAALASSDHTSSSAPERANSSQPLTFRIPERAGNCHVFATPRQAAQSGCPTTNGQAFPSSPFGSLECANSSQELTFRSPERASNRHAFPTPRHSEPNGAALASSDHTSSGAPEGANRSQALTFRIPERAGNCHAFATPRHSEPNGAALASSNRISFNASRTPGCGSNSPALAFHTLDGTGSNDASPGLRHAAQSRCPTPSGHALLSHDRPSSDAPGRVNNGQPLEPAARLANYDGALFTTNRPAFPPSAFGSPDRANNGRMLPPIAFRTPERATNRHPFATPRHSEPNGAPPASSNRISFNASRTPGCGSNSPALAFHTLEGTGRNYASPGLRHAAQSRCPTPSGHALPPHHRTSSNAPNRGNNGQPLAPAARFANCDAALFTNTRPAAFRNSERASTPERAGNCHALALPRRSTTNRPALPSRDGTSSSAPERVANGRVLQPAAPFAHNGQAFTVAAGGAALFSIPQRAGDCHAIPSRGNNGQPLEPAARFANCDAALFTNNRPAAIRRAIAAHSSIRASRIPKPRATFRPEPQP